MNLFSSAALAAALAIAAAYGASGNTPESDAVAAAKTAGFIQYRLIVAGSRSDCILSKEIVADGNVSGVDLAETCRSVLPVLSDVAAWREETDHSVTLVSSEGRGLLRLGFADGSAYESFEPASPIVSLTAP